jgi:general secretion pathway protein B
LLAGFIGLGGLSLGWTLANYQEVLTLLSPQSDKPVVSMSAPVPTAVASATKQLDDNIEPSVQVNNLQDDTPDVIANVPAQQIPNTGDTEQSEMVQEIIPSPEPEPQISADVLARFRKAMTEVEDSPADPPPVEKLSSSEAVPRIDQLPAWVMTRLPSMAFSAHMYASLESERWVRVNGSRMVEGDKIDGVIEIVRIEPQHVILNYSGQTFSMAALTDW